MSQIMKAFTGMFIVMFMMVSATGVLSMFFQAMYAQNLHAVIIDELENSNYAESVVEAAFAKAQKSNFKLEIELYYRKGRVLTCVQANQLRPMEGEVDSAKVILIYPVRVSFFQLERTAEVVGYAR